jgi:hypothetical protein
MPVTASSFALDARRLKVTLPSADTSGECMAGPRPEAGSGERQKQIVVRKIIWRLP